MNKQPEAAENLCFEPQDIPEYAMRIAGMALFEMTERILRQPGGREMLDRETERRQLKQRERAENYAPK